MLDQIGNYRVINLINTGGFAHVYEVRKIGTVNSLALKVISLHNLKGEIDIQAEIEIHSRQNHPHILPLLDYWVDADAAYLLMPFLRGGNLSQKLATYGAFSPLAATLILNQIADALNHLHRQYIIHQDIKPENILFDECGRAYLADFGLARDLLAPEKSQSQKALFGSPRYVSPEQLRRQTSNPQSDIYSWGLLIYQALTGFPP